jgi:cell division protease FtsH
MSKKKFGKNFNKFSPGAPKNFIAALLIVCVTLFVLYKLIEWGRETTPLSYSAFLDKVEHNEVLKVHVSGQEVQGHLKDGSHFETVVGDTPQNWDILKKHNVDVHVENPAHSINWWAMLPWLFLFIFNLIAGWYFIRQSRGSNGGNGGSNPFTMGKSKARMYLPSEIKENFNSVAGAQEAKEELQEVVDFLKHPEKYKKIGAKIPRGILMVGAPGNGKTLLARAVAGEVHCPFFSISGSDFIEVFVGVGASRVRDLFAQARKHAPCIIFIDEIDAVGRQRGSGLGGGHDEREQTLNQLLIEMDGFQQTAEPVIVMAATNRPDVLDSALLRPGRFDRRVEVPYPDLKSRLQILQVHTKEVPIDDTVNLEKIARGTPGFSGADLANLVNEAALIASKNDVKKVGTKEFEEARDKLLLGKESKSIMLTEEDRKETAYHEAGHALIGLLMPEHTDPLHKITIIPRGRALGVTHSMPEREKYGRSKKEMLASVCVCLGGRAAEELQFGELKTGAYSDFLQATKTVRSMVCNLGMSEKLGPVIYDNNDRSYYFSQATEQLIDEEIRAIMKSCYEKSMQMLKDNKDKLDALANALLEKETMYASEVYELLGIPPREDHRLV